MTVYNYDPIGPNTVVPPSLLRLAEHPDRKRWSSAILLRKASGRWPDWSCEFALATVDSGLQVHESYFLVRPPVGWEEDERRDFPPGITANRLLEEGLSPGQALTILNEILGEMEVHTNGGMRMYDSHRAFEAGAAVRASWEPSGVWSGIGDQLRIRLTENAHVDFVSTPPLQGPLAARARCWADGYVAAEFAHRLLMQSLERYREAK